MFNLRPALRSAPRACGFPVPTPRRGQEMENAVVLREWFDRVDAGRTGNITAAQLQGALAVGNLNFPISVVQQMIRMYDFDRNGTMNFEEFLALNKFLQKVQNVFSTLDRYCLSLIFVCSLNWLFFVPPPF